MPWLPEQVFAVRAALPDRYQAMADPGAGCGLRQGEIIGLAEDDCWSRSSACPVAFTDATVPTGPHPFTPRAPGGGRPGLADRKSVV